MDNSLTHFATAEDLKQFEIARRFKRMAEKMAAMIDWPDEEKMERASGQCLCSECGLDYFSHPSSENGLTLTCDGRLLHL